MLFLPWLSFKKKFSKNDVVEHPSHTAYRHDIDGLRAVAVLAVIGFHAFPEWLRGGFIGVDIFFVISGFLISTIIFKGLEAQRFSFLDFYARRVRRIFPALIIVLIASLVMGWFVFLADEYKSLGRHVAGAAIFVSNFVLVKEAGYFDPAAITKPLLHLWSLGIEEQFYIGWPIALWLLWRLRKKKFALILFATALLFGWNLARVLLRPESTATFYLPQARFWELLIGATLAYTALFPIKFFEEIKSKIGVFLSASPTPRTEHILGNLKSFAGVTLIITSILILTQDHPFPGYWALMPTIGAALLISAGAQTFLNRNLLSHPWMVFIGTISYPLYLWHWPILSFAHVVVGDTPSPVTRAACIAAAFALAWLTYVAIEKPLRFGHYLRQKTSVLIVVMVAIGCAGYLTYRKNGLEFRDFAQRTKALVEAGKDWEYPGDLVAQRVSGVELGAGTRLYASMGKPPQILVTGDSHIEQYAARISKGSRQGSIPTMFLTGDGCPMIPNVYANLDRHCWEQIENLKKILQAEPSIETIVIGGFWNGYLLKYKQFHYLNNGSKIPLHTAEGKRLALMSLEKFIQELSKKYTVYLVLDNPDMPQLKPGYIINRLTYRGPSDLPATALIPHEQAALNRELRAIGQSSGAEIIDPLPHLCPNEKCVRISHDGKPIYMDADHLTATYVKEKAVYMDKMFHR
jgi:peptidoglycan/LPS O-acetylase OafA/YrhL